MIRRARAWVLRFGGLLTRSRRQREFDDELESHIAMHVDDNIRAGLTPAEARRQALIALGGLSPLRERYRDRLGVPSADAVLQDLRFGWRMLKRTPLMSLFAIVAIALGVGINTMVFSLVNAVLYKPLPAADADRLVFVGTLSAQRGGDIDGLSWPDFNDLRSSVRSFSSLAAAASMAADLNDDNGYAEPLRGTEVTVDAFETAGIPLRAGRQFVESDTWAGAPAVAILSARIWRSRYGSDPGVLGRTVRLNGTPTTIIGVAGDAPLIEEGLTGVWMPFRPGARWQRRDWRRLLVFGKLAPGETVRSADTEVAAIGSGLAREYPQTNSEAPLIARDFRGFSLPERVRTLFLVMLGAVALVLLVACANVANLMLARAAGRNREVAIRTAIGATRRRIVRQLLLESFVLSSGGALLGLLIAVVGVRAFDAALIDTQRPLWLDFSVDFMVLGYLAAITIATTILFGLAPAWRLSSVRASAAMKEASHAGGRRRSRMIMSTLVVVEMALSVILLAAAGVMIRSFLNVHRVTLGFERENLQTFRLNTARYFDTDDERSRTLREVVMRLQAIPGVEAAAVTGHLPLSNHTYEVPLTRADGQSSLTSVVSVIGPFDRAVGAPVRTGRFFTVAESMDTATVAVVNETLAARSWPGEAAVGKQFRLATDGKREPWLTVVGVMPDIVQHGRERHRPVLYVPYSLLLRSDVGVVVRSASATPSLFADIRTAIRVVNPDLPVIELDTFNNHFYVNHWPARVFGGLFTVFGAVALLLASVGLYGVTSYAAAQRAHEFGVRMALGATTRNVMTQVASGSLKQLGTALLIGLGGAAALTRLLSAQLVGVSPNDPSTFAGVAVVLTVTAIAGCILPVRRALSVNPVEALRHE